MKEMLKKELVSIVSAFVIVLMVSGCAGLPGGSSNVIDKVYIGNPASENSHKMQVDASENGVNIENWRHAIDGGYFQYQMKTGGSENINLSVRYWSHEVGERTFNIYVEDEIIATENVVGKFNKEEIKKEFYDVEYPIPPDLVRGKEFVIVKFQGVDEYNMAGGVYGLSLLKAGETAQ
jgi:hypothetical protein